MVIDRRLTAGDSLPKALGAESSIRAITLRPVSLCFCSQSSRLSGMDTGTGESSRKLRLKD